MTTQKKKYNPTLFISLVGKNFKFLEQKFGFFAFKVEDEAWGEAVTYINKTTAIKISLEERDGGIFLELCKLIDGCIPEKPITITQKTKLYSFEFENLLLLRAPSLQLEHPLIDDLVFKPGKEKVMGKVLKQYADTLKIYAKDVLKGDFTVFSDLEKLVKNRIRN